MSKHWSPDAEERARTVLEALHQPAPDSRRCATCGPTVIWPCPVRVLLDSPQVSSWLECEEQHPQIALATCFVEQLLSLVDPASVTEDDVDLLTELMTLLQPERLSTGPALN